MASRAPQFSVPGTLEAACVSVLPDAVTALDPEYLRRQRWFGSKNKPITGVRLKEYAVLQATLPVYVLTLIEVAYAGYPPEMYSLPLMIVNRAVPERDLLLELKTPSEMGFVYEALTDDEFCRTLLGKVAESGTVSAAAGRFVFEKTRAYMAPSTATVKRSRAEQSNTSIIFGDALILKYFRKVESGINPDLEISKFLTDRTDFSHLPRLAGTVEYFGDDRQPESRIAIGLLQSLVPNQGDGWDYTLRHLQDFYGRVAGSAQNAKSGSMAPDQPAEESLRTYETEASRLGQITAHLHLALASDPRNPPFAPEPISLQDVDCWRTTITEHVEAGLAALDRNLPSYDQNVQHTAVELLRRKSDYLKKIEGLKGLEASHSVKIRCHGDYHLGQVLKTADGFCVLDFEGEPMRSLTERREKACPLKDVAGMLRSYHYAAYAGLFAHAEEHHVDKKRLEPSATSWERHANQAFLRSYIAATQDTAVRLVPASAELLMRVLSVFLLDKAFYELNYEMNHRPSWVKIPLEGIQNAMTLS
jgi:maltose alpha-D-glucosyltransferase/alpha-amylase